MVENNGEITLDMSETTQLPTRLSKEGQRTRKSYPGEAVYQKRKKWWMGHGFGEAAAKWAASWRLGEPKKTRHLKDWEENAVDNAIRIGERRPALVKYRMKAFDKTREETIKHLDDELRRIDKEGKVEGGRVESTISIYHRLIEPNIFKDLYQDVSYRSQESTT